MAHGTLRGSAAFCHFMIFASSVIVTGIVSYFLNKYRFRGAHIVYQEVIVRPKFGLSYVPSTNYRIAGSDHNTDIFICNDCPNFQELRGLLSSCQLYFLLPVDNVLYFLCH